MTREKKVKTVVSHMRGKERTKPEEVVKKGRMMENAISVVCLVTVSMSVQAKEISAIGVEILGTKPIVAMRRLLASIVEKMVTRARCAKSQRRRLERCLL
jgi:hypothetical protein